MIPKYTSIPIVQFSYEGTPFPCKLYLSKNDKNNFLYV